MSETQASLYERLGSFDGIAAITEDIWANHTANDVVKQRYVNSGMILACQTLLKSDAIVDIELGASEDQSAAVATVTGRLTATRMLTHDIMELTVNLDAPLRGDGDHYKAGQYADLTFPGISNPRSYSFAAPPESDGSNGLCFYIRKVPNGELTSWLFAKDRVGTEVSVSGPYGSFWLREGTGPVVCVAGGSGMSSIKALLEHAANLGCERDVVSISTNSSTPAACLAGAIEERTGMVPTPVFESNH